mmetsp:Transcript_37554/g.86708  ORF Transcript_37554/g.86708 Transcript_37554/m.86708 type:complete len:102 (-) Transcript_37554:255-560(-)
MMSLRVVSMAALMAVLAMFLQGCSEESSEVVAETTLEPTTNDSVTTTDSVDNVTTTEGVENVTTEAPTTTESVENATTTEATETNTTEANATESANATLLL